MNFIHTYRENFVRKKPLDENGYPFNFLLYLGKNCSDNMSM
jgi:hypothetical protein